MAVIKSSQPASVLTPFSIRDIELQAQALLLRARRAAELLLGEAQREGEVIKATAKAEGFTAGKSEGFAQGVDEGRKTGHAAAMAEAKPEMTQVLSALTNAVHLIEASRLDLESAGINEVVKLAAAIARRVTKLQSAIDPQVLLENVKEAMKLAVQAADVSIVINPAQRAVLERELPVLGLHWPTVKHIELIDDASIEVGGCRIVTRQGEIDARIDKQLDRVISDLAPDTFHAGV